MPLPRVEIFRETWGDTNCLNCNYPGDFDTNYCDVVTVNCMGLLEHLRPYLVRRYNPFLMTRNWSLISSIQMWLLVYTFHQVVINASQFSWEQWGLCLFTAVWFSAECTLGKENLKLLDAIVTVKTLVGRKYYSSRRHFAKTQGAIRTYSVSSKAVMTKL